MADPRSDTERRYANWLEVSFSTEDFVLDFGQSFDEGQVAPHSRIVATPRSLIAFIDILTRSLAEHRRRYGTAGYQPER